MYFIGIDIGSTSTKVAVYDTLINDFCDFFLKPTGFSAKQISKEIYNIILEKNYTPNFIVATGYGRVSIDYANLTLSEILCHGAGAIHLYPNNCTVIDVGGQDTKAILINNKNLDDFIMNDKCSAGTGKFIEIMANRLGLDLSEIYNIALENSDIKLSSTCTVFAESEIVSLIANGVAKEEIAFAIIKSSAKKVASLVRKLENKIYFLTGGLSKVSLFLKLLAKELNAEILTDKNAIFAGAIGASLMGVKKNESK